MWSVVRRHQEMWCHTPSTMDPEEVKRMQPSFHRNQITRTRHISSKDNYHTMHLPSSKVNLKFVPYGRRIHIKLLSLIQGKTDPNLDPDVECDSPETRRKCLRMLLDLYSQKIENIVHSLNQGAVEVFIESLQDEDAQVRSLACNVLESLASHLGGTEAILQGGHVPAILEILSDQEPDVVANGLRLCCAFRSVVRNGTEELVRHKAIPIYVAKASDDNLEVRSEALRALTNACDVKEAYIDILDAGGFGPITRAVSSEHGSLLRYGCDCISKLTFYSAGKRMAVVERSVVPVLGLMKHADPVIRKAASAALVALTISEDGKRQAIEAGIVAVLQDCLETEQVRDVLVNEIKTICNISEHPAAREELKRCLPRLREMTTSVAEGDDRSSVAKGAQRAIAMIKWRPGDVY